MNTAFSVLRTLLFAITSLAFISVAAAPSTAHAQSVTEFTEVSANDKSAQLLEGLFGPVFRDVTEFDGTSPANGVPNSATEGGMLGTLSVVLNEACMIVTVIIIMSSLASGVLTAAYEGGNARARYNTLWSPIRSVGSFAMLAEVAGGYSLIQVAVMKAAFLGVGIANAGYFAVLDYVGSGRPITYQQMENAYELANNLVRTHLCEQTLNEGTVKISMAGGGSSEQTISPSMWGVVGNAIAGAAAIAPSSSSKSAFDVRYIANPGSSLKTGSAICGAYAFSQVWNSDTPAGQAQKAIYDAKVHAFQSLSEQMAVIAERLRGMDHPDSDATLPSDTPTTADDAYGPILDDFERSVRQFDQTVRQVVTDRTASLNSTFAGSGSSNIRGYQEIRDSGWMMLGGIYWNLQAMNRQVASALSVPAGTPPIDKQIAEASTEIASRYVDVNQTAEPFFRRSLSSHIMSNTNFPEIAAYVSSTGESEVTAGITGSQFARAALAMLHFDDMTESFIQDLTSDGDFIAKMQTYGHWLFGTGMTIAAASYLFSDMTEVASNSDSKDGSSRKGIVRFVASPLSWVIKKGAGLLVMLGPTMIIVGLFLGFYLPFVPMLLWIINVVTWIIGVLKAVIAAPLWAAAHAIPEGDGWAGTSARQGYFLMISLILRPLLMVIGIIAGMMMIQIAGVVSGFLFPVMMRSASLDSVFGIGSVIVYIAMFTGLLVVLSHKCFALSHELSDEILKWIGAGLDQLGDSELSHRSNAVLAGSILHKSESLGEASMRAGSASAQSKGNRPGSSSKPGSDDAQSESGPKSDNRDHIQ